LLPFLRLLPFFLPSSSFLRLASFLPCILPSVRPLAERFGEGGRVSRRHPSSFSSFTKDRQGRKVVKKEREGGRKEGWGGGRKGRVGRKEGCKERKE
jgi:hypothetical protein